MTTWRDISPACAAVEDAALPSPDAGGPCGTCAFRKGSEANRSEHTTMLVAMCVEGFREFDCHEKPQLCRGFIAALNLRGVPEDEEDRRWSEMMGDVADTFGRLIDMAVDEQNKAVSRD